MTKFDCQERNSLKLTVRNELRFFVTSCMERLENSTMLLEWGDTETLDQVQFDDPAKIYQLNPDILFPLAKTYSQMLKGDNRLPTVSSITFRKENYVRLDEAAKFAARLMYDSSK